MADHRNSHNDFNGFNLLDRIELDALRGMTPVNPTQALAQKNQIIKRIQQGFYERDDVLEHLLQQLVPLYFRKLK